MALVAVFIPLAGAQKAPDIGYVFPPGGQAGNTVSVNLGGYDWTSDMETFCIGTPVELSVTGQGGQMLVPSPPYWFGAKANTFKAFLIPREFPATFTIPPGTPPGTIHWQAANANGATKSGLFVVGTATEVSEEEDRIKPQHLPSCPVVVNGRIRRIEEVDRYSYVALHDGIVTCELTARRIGSPLHAVLKVLDEQGTLIADTVDSEGIDTSVSFSVTAGHKYLIHLHDLDFRGNRAFVYRLALTTGPHVLTTIPAVVQRGAETQVEFIGTGLQTGAATIERVSRSVNVPLDFPGKELQYPLPNVKGASARFGIPLSNIPEFAASFGDARPVLLNCPSGVTSRFVERDDRHFYQITGKAGEHWRIAAEAQRFGSSLDLAVQIQGPSGNDLSGVDDMPHTVDPTIDFVVPDDGVYTVVISDSSLSYDDPKSIYRLSIQHQEPNFQLMIPQTATIQLGGELQLPLTVKRLGGFCGTVSLSWNGLPAGVTGPDSFVIEAEQNEASIPFKSDHASPVHASLVTVKGMSTIAEDHVIRTATAMTSRNPVPHVPAANAVSQMLLAVTMKPRAEVKPADTGVSRTANRGTTYPAKIIVNRLEEFSGPVVVRMSAYQQRHRQGIDAEDVIVPADVTHAEFPCYLPEWLETDRTSRIRMTTVVDVPDPGGNVRQLVHYNDAAISLSLEGALLKISHSGTDVGITQGGRVEVPVRIARAVKLMEPVRLELLVPDNLKGSIQAEGVDVATNDDEAVLVIESTSNSGLTGRRTLTIQATALQAGRYRVVAHTLIDVLFL